MSAARDCLGDVVTDALPLLGRRVDRLTETGAGLPVLFGCPLAKNPGRIGHLLAKLRASSWGEPHRHGGADERPCHESDHEAVVWLPLRVCIHVRCAPPST